MTRQDKTRQDKTRQDKTIFDDITKDDLIIAFFPCIYFSAVSQMEFSLNCHNYRGWSEEKKIAHILERSKKRQNMYELLIKFCGVCIAYNIRMIFENPYSMQTYLKANFIKSPDIVDMNRMERGDYYMKPTAFWFWNCEHTHGFTHQNDKEKKTIEYAKKASRTGMCSEERSMISPDYARNFICDFILGKKQDIGQLSLF